DEWTERGSRISVESDGAVDPAADLGEAQADQADQNHAQEIREYRCRPQHASRDPRQAEDAGSDDAVEGGRGKRGGPDHAFEMRPGMVLRARDVVHRDNANTDELVLRHRQADCET